MVPAKPSTVLTATGTVTGLDLARIAIGPTKCTLGAKSAALAGSFSIGEHVTIGCVSGVLRTIKLVGDVTCSFYGSDFASPSRLALVERISTSSGSLYSLLTQKLHVAVGDTAQFSCTDSGSSSSGRLTIS
jgi:hypothetical protein